MLWFVLPSVLCLMALAVGDDVVQPLICVVCQLLRVRNLRVEMAHDVQDVDSERIGAVSLFLRDEVQEFAGSSDGLNLLL